MVTLVVPAVILRIFGAPALHQGLAAPRIPLTVLGVALAGVGLLLMTTTIALFARVGKGTLAPWNPTQRLVVRGPYRFVRNPMISGVLFILAGETALLASPPLLLWFLTFFLLNAIYLPLSEEPGLVKRFGRDYEVYRRHVPRWIPRLTPWLPPSEAET